MKGHTNLLLIAMIAAAPVGCGRAQDASSAPQWRAVLKVVDESDQPIAGADVTIGYYVPPPPDKTIEMSSVKGRTDTNGLFSASGRTRSTDLFFGAEKDGYYRCHLEHEFARFKESDPAKWNPEVTLLLKSVGQPVPMFAKHVETKIAKENEPLGFDLMAGDWVKPYGTGETADMLFTLQRKIVSDQDYDARLILTFPKTADGIISLPPAPSTGSALLMPKQAPDAGYQTERGWKYSQSEHPAGVLGYMFRVRTLLDANGNVKSTQYGKLPGDISLYVGTRAPKAGLEFTYYLNPRPNDRNVEFDPQQNLLKGLSWREKVEAP